MADTWWTADTRGLSIEILGRQCPLSDQRARSDSVFVEHVKGYPPNPMTHDEVEDKARELMTPVLGRVQTEALIELAWRVDTLSDAGVFPAAMAAS